MKTTIEISDHLMGRIRRLAREQHVTWTADRDFSRFRGLRTRNPLIQA